MIILIVLASTGVGVGIALVVTGFFASTSVAKKMSFTKRIDPTTRHAALAALVGAAVLGLVTRWPVGAAIGAAVGWTLWSAVFSSSPRRTTSRLDALATWIETLRDSVAAHRGLVAAIESTVPSAPASLRANIEALVIRIKSGTPLDKAFAALASELADASADEAIAPLILASRFGGADLQNLLGTAAASTREQLALVQRTEVARAQPRREMRLVVVVTLGFVLATVTIGHGYFKPFSSTIGQIVLLLIAGLFAVAILSTQLTSQATTIVGPYTADANTLHLWHMDTGVPVLDAVVTGGTNLAKLFNGATLAGVSSYSGFGTALNTVDGGQNGVAAGNTDAYLTPSSGATVGTVAITVVDPTTGAFTMEAIVWIGFDPTKNLGTTANGGNNRGSVCQIITGEGPDATPAARLFQFRIAPIKTANLNTVPRLEFSNVGQGGASQLMTFAIPTNSTDVNVIVSNAWYHVAVAYNGVPNTADNMKFYWTLLDGTRTNANQIGSTNMTQSLGWKLGAAPTVFAIGNIAGRTANANFQIGRASCRERV